MQVLLWNDIDSSFMGYLFNIYLWETALKKLR